MSSVRRAVIDVGTNSIKLLVADVAGGEVRPLLEDSRQTRLGQGLYQGREPVAQLQAEAISQTAKAAAEFAGLAREMNAASIRMVATSAARDAVNAVQLTAALEDGTGVKTEIISGEQEADLAFQGVTTAADLANTPLLLLDVGGGSSEFILGQGKEQHFRQSFPLGTVRLMEFLPQSNPPTAAELAACRRWLRRFLNEHVRPKLDPAMRREVDGVPAGRLQLVGTGGTAVILARMEARLEDYDRGRIEATVLGLDRARWHTEHLWGMSLTERQEVVGLPPSRADVILSGVAIYEAIMEQLEFEVLRVTTRGLRYALAMRGLD